MKILMAIPDKLSFMNKDEYSLDLLTTVEALTSDPSLVDKFIKSFATTGVKLGFDMGDVINPLNSSLYGLVCIDQDFIDTEAFVRGIEESLEAIGDAENNILIITPSTLDDNEEYFKKNKVETTTELEDTIRDLHSLHTPSSKLVCKGLDTLCSSIGFPNKGNLH